MTSEEHPTTADICHANKETGHSQLPSGIQNVSISDPHVVSLSQNDHDHPYNWPQAREWVIIALVFLISLVDNLATVMITPTVPQVLEEFDVHDDFYLTLLVSIWELGEAVGPFLIAPLSERYGRLPILHCGNLLSVLCGVGGALSNSVSMLVAFRFLNGLVTTSSTLGPSIVADLFPKERRGTAMALTTAIPMTGSFLSPVIGSYLGAAAGWRWTVWFNVIASGALAVPLLVLFRETYQAKILERRILKMRQDTGNTHLRSCFQEEIDQDSKVQALTCPMLMLIFAPTVLIISSMTALTYGLSFVILTTLTSIMQTIYKLEQDSVGLAFLGRDEINFLPQS